jgi:hypothetical protein
MKNKKVKKPKKIKLQPISKIQKRLYKIWSDVIRERAGWKCEFCGIENKATNINGVPTKLDAHHFISRKIKDMPLKFEIQNGICACPICHKWGIPSFHRDPITTITWLITNRPDRYKYVLDNSAFRVDLDNRKVLEEIEQRLLAKESLNLEKLKQIEQEFPREQKKTKEQEETIVDMIKREIKDNKKEDQ